jgi:uncharacterized membrane protein
MIAMTVATKIALISAGGFFLTGLLTGVWKFLAIRRSPEATAPVYVDIGHRAALLYSFAALLLAKFAELSPYSPAVTIAATIAPIAFFAFAIFSYLVHGVLRDTDNQLARPFVLGKRRLPAWLIDGAMWLLIAAEIGGFLVLFVGVCQVLL